MTLRERIQAASRCSVEGCERQADWQSDPEMRVARCREHTEALFVPEWRKRAAERPHGLAKALDRSTS